MTDMIERVARAICAELESTVYDPVDYDVVEECWPRFVSQARAAIEAMREPTDGMLAEADNMLPRFEEEPNEPRMMGVDGALVAWQAMIDTALEATDD
jgi:hypothetical protein